MGAPNDKPQGFTKRIPPDVTQEKHIAGLPIGTRGGTLFSYTFAGDPEITISLESS